MSGAQDSDTPADWVEVIPEPVIVARTLARWYGNVVGLTDLTIDIPTGITGLLGPNGAGKSTFMRLLTGIIHPSSGSVRILGKNPVAEPEVFHRIGFCSEDDALFDDLTPRRMVSFLARCSGYSRSEALDRTEVALKRCGIEHAAERLCGTFSKGMRQRTRMAAALVHDPEILLLDEPMTGLDPIGRRDVVDIIRDFAGEGRSVLFSSHILHEVEAVAEHVVVMSKGMALAEGTLEHIQSCLTDYAFTLSVQSSRPRELAQAILGLDHITGVKFVEADRLDISTASATSLMRDLPRMALNKGIPISEISAPAENLEALFERLTR